MNRVLVTVAALAVAAICFAVAVLVPEPAMAQECFSNSDLQEAAQLAGDRIVGIVDYDGVHSDQAIVTDDGNSIWLFVFKDGCIAGFPVPIDAAKPRGVPS